MNRFRLRPCLLVPTVAASVVLALSACSSSSTDNSGAPSQSATGTPSSSSTAGAVGADVAAASSFIKPYLTTASTINVTTPLPKTPERGITVGFINGNSASQQVNGRDFSTAAQALGWVPKIFLFDPTNPQSIGQAMEQAIAAHVKYMAIQGVNSPAYASALADAKKAGIPLIQLNLVSETNAAAKGIAACISCDPSFALWMKLLANWIISDSHGQAHVAYVSIKEYSSGAYYLKQLTSTFTSGCSGCNLTAIDASVQDLASGGIPGLVSSYLQTHQDINYVIFPFAETMDNVRSTLNAAGIGKNVKFVVNYPDLAGMQDLIDGSAQAAAAWGGGEQMFDLVDAMARLSLGVSPAPDEAPTTTRIWTTSNTPKPAVIYDGPTGYQEQFKKLWGVK